MIFILISYKIISKHHVFVISTLQNAQKHHRTSQPSGVHTNTNLYETSHFTFRLLFTSSTAFFTRLAYTLALTTLVSMLIL